MEADPDEADRIAIKHLLTLEPGISRRQTDEMTAQSVVLVVPSSIEETFTAKQRSQLMTVRDFLNELGH